MIQIEEILDAAEKLKGIGNEQFKAQDYKVAEKKYTKTLRQDKVKCNFHELFDAIFLCLLFMIVILNKGIWKSIGLRDEEQNLNYWSTIMKLKILYSLYIR